MYRKVCGGHSVLSGFQHPLSILGYIPWGQCARGNYLQSLELWERDLSFGIISMLKIFKSINIGNITSGDNIKGKEQKFRR
jgi:hypothetical protein